jgi:hypothetical protein
VIGLPLPGKEAQNPRTNPQASCQYDEQEQDPHTDVNSDAYHKREHGAAYDGYSNDHEDYDQ